MQRIKLLALASVLAVVFFVPMTVQAGPSSGSTDSIEDIADVYYDWDVWIAEHVTGYKVYFKNKHGVIWKGGWFDTEEDAAERVAYLESRLTVVEAWIVPYSGPGPWELLNTFDKRADAEAVAAKAGSFGFYTKIVRIDVFGSTVP